MERGGGEGSLAVMIDTAMICQLTGYNSLKSIISFCKVSRLFCANLRRNPIVIRLNTESKYEIR